MSDKDYDGSVSLPRKLTEEETRELQIRLLPYFHATGGMGMDDVTDFLDFTFAMVSNSKDVDYIVKELIGMEMEFCSPEVAAKVGRAISDYIASLTGEKKEDGNAKVRRRMLAKCRFGFLLVLYGSSHVDLSHVNSRVRKKRVTH